MSEQPKTISMDGLIRFAMVNQNVMAGFLPHNLVAVHQFDDFGNHRLLISDHNNNSEWVWHQGFAIVDVLDHDLRVFATSDSWRGLWPEVFYCTEASKQFENFGKMRDGG